MADTNAPASAPETKKPRKVKTIWVKAVHPAGAPSREDEMVGWYGLTPTTHKALKHGEIFQCWEEDFSNRWMTKHNGPPPAPPAVKPASPGQVTDLSRRIEELTAENARLRAAAAAPEGDVKPPPPPAPPAPPAGGKK